MNCIKALVNQQVEPKRLEPMRVFARSTEAVHQQNPRKLKERSYVDCNFGLRSTPRSQLSWHITTGGTGGLAFEITYLRERSSITTDKGRQRRHFAFHAGDTKPYDECGSVLCRMHYTIIGERWFVLEAHPLNNSRNDKRFLVRPPSVLVSSSSSSSSSPSPSSSSSPSSS
jgi:hypothetical protein